MSESKHAPNPDVQYNCVYCNQTVRLRDVDAVVDCYFNVCHYRCSKRCPDCHAEKGKGRGDVRTDESYTGSKEPCRNSFHTATVADAEKLWTPWAEWCDRDPEAKALNGKLETDELITFLKFAASQLSAAREEIARLRADLQKLKYPIEHAKYRDHTYAHWCDGCTSLENIWAALAGEPKI